MSRNVFITGAPSGIGEAFSFGTTALATARPGGAAPRRAAE